MYLNMNMEQLDSSSEDQVHSDIMREYGEIQKILDMSTELRATEKANILGLSLNFKEK